MPLRPSPGRPGSRDARTATRGSHDVTVGLLFHFLAVTILVAGVLLAQAAAAQDRKSLMRDACLADYRQLCSSVTPGDGRIRQCMRDHADELSPDCRAAVLSEVDR